MSENKPAEKQWWQRGYEAAGNIMNQPRPEFADKKGDGSGKGGFGLWQPDNFFVPLAKAPETKRVKQGIIVEDDPFYTRQHLGKVHNSRFTSGEAWELFTCGSTGDYYEAVVYEDLKGYKGKDGIPGNFTPCCGEFFRAMSKKNNPLPGNPMDVVYYTIIDTEGYTDKRGIEHKYVLKLFPAKGDTIDKLVTLRESHGPLTGCLYNFIRFRNKQSASTGEMMTFGMKGDMSQLFTSVMYSGRLLSDIFDQARSDSKFRDALSQIFELPTAPDGDEILNKVPVFNYRNIFAPKSLDVLRNLFGKGSTPAATVPATPSKSASAGIPGFAIPGFGIPQADGDDDRIPF